MAETTRRELDVSRILGTRTPQLEIEERKWFPIPQTEFSHRWFPIVQQAVRAKGCELLELRKFGERMLWGTINRQGTHYAILVTLPKEWVR